MLRKIRIWPYGAVSALALSTFAIQPASSQELLEAIIVSPHLTPLASPQQTGSAVTVLTEAEIANSGQIYVSDLLRRVPGVAVSQSGPRGSLTNIRIRGAESRHTKVIIDGIEANSPHSNDAFNFGTLLTADIEQIEILRGPQSALYGSDAIGGVIVITTKRGRTPGAYGSFKGEGGSRGTASGSAQAGFGTDVFQMDLAVSGLRTDGYNIARTGSDRDGSENVTINAKTHFTPTENLEFGTVMRRTMTDTEFDDDLTFDGFLDDADRSQRDDMGFFRGYVRAFSFDRRWTNTFNVQFTDHERDAFADGMRTNGSLEDHLKFTLQSDLILDQITPWERDSHTVSVLLERETSRFKNDPNPVWFPDPDELEAARQRHSIDQNSIAAEYRFGYDDTLFLSAGLRYDDNSRFDDALTYRFTASKLFERTGTRLHASYGTGVKNPSFTELFGFNPNSFIGNPDLGPERARGFDVGVEQTFWNGRAIIDVTYFNHRLTDLIDGFVCADPPACSTFTAENIPGKSPRQGVEISLSAHVTPDLVLSGSYTYLDAKTADGEREIRRPRHMANVTLDYAFHDGRGNVQLSADYNGRQKDRFFGAFPAPLVTLDDFVLVNVAAWYDINPNVRLYGRIENLLDQSYEEVFSFRGAPRAAYAGMRIHF